MLKMKKFVNKFYRPLKQEDLSKRIHKEKSGRERNPFQRDYSRILYSSSFRRLQGKMQLLGVQQDKFHRNRLTHSLEVSQIARGIAEKIQDLVKDEKIYSKDIYVVEAASLAHDIGNPPFGHHGEHILNKIMQDYGGYEGNAQTLRVLNSLEKKLPKHKGLNLTNRSLLSVVKYNHKNEKGNKKFLYDEDYKVVNDICEKNNINLRTVDAQIMDLADEIAYGAHDLEDALSINLFNIDEFLYEFKKYDFKVTKGKENFKKLENIVLDAKKVASGAEMYNSSEEYSFLFRKELISNIVNILILDIGVVKVSNDFKEETGTSNEYELGFKTNADLAAGLKKITFKCINRTDIVQIYEKQGEKIIKGLFEAFMDDEFNKDNKLLPIEFREEENRMRNISDYISGMMDSYAVKVYEDIYGKSSLEKLYDPSYFKDYKNPLLKNH